MVDSGCVHLALDNLDNIPTLEVPKLTEIWNWQGDTSVLPDKWASVISAIANENGEVYCFIVKKYPTANNLQVRKNDFIYHIKASNMFSLFESIDPDSHSRWQTLAVTAFKSVSEKLQVESKDPTFQVI